jgi:transcription antitermination factor NusG
MKNEKFWFAVFTNPRAEKKVAERLELDGYEVYLPLVTTIRQWSDRKKKVKLPLINSYVFVHTTKKELRGTLNTAGVVCLLTYLRKPAIIRDHEINNMKILLKQVVDENGLQTMKSEDLAKGELVEILQGPFKGLMAEYVQHQGRYDVALRLEALGSVILIHVDQEYIRKISA